VKITMTSLNTHCDALKNIKKYQFYQTKVGYCELLLEVDDKFNANDLQVVSNVFQSKVGNELLIKCRIVEKVSLTKRGKHQFIVSELY